MRHGDRPAARDLLAKARDHAAGRAEHVAEAHHDELGPALRLQRLAEHLRQALGGAHDVGRIHRLVGRDEHEFLRPRGLRRARGDERRQGVVRHRLEGVVLLHQRHVLVGRGVEHDLRRVAREYLLHAPRVLRVADRCRDRHAGQAVAELLLYRVQREFGDVEEHDPRRREARDLARELRADRAAGARDEDRLAVEKAVQARGVERHRVATQQVVELDLAHRRDADASRDDVPERRHGHDGNAGLRAKLHRALSRAVRRAGHRHDRLRDPEPRRDLAHAL